MVYLLFHCNVVVFVFMQKELELKFLKKHEDQKTT
jgi:hypothetical protein